MTQFIFPIIIVAVGLIFFAIGFHFGFSRGFNNFHSKLFADIRILKIDKKINKYQMQRLNNIPEKHVIDNTILRCINGITQHMGQEYFHIEIKNHMDGDVNVHVSLKILAPCKKEK